MITHSLHSAPTAERIHDEDERVNPATAGVGDAPRRKMFGKTKLHSLRYVSYSIPLACIMTLLVGVVYGTCFIASEYNSAYADTADSVDASINLSIAESELATAVAPGAIGYLSSNVTYSAANTTEYVLQISYAQNSTALSNKTSTIGGAGGKTGATLKSIDTDAWGFGWGDVGDDNDNLTYYTMPAYGTSGVNLATGRLEVGTTTSETTKKLVFAAKFAQGNENAGNYKTDILLSLTATPKTLYNYTLLFDLNGGDSGAPESIIVKNQSTINYTFNIPDITPLRSGRVFMGWATLPNAIEPAYQPGGQFMVARSGIDTSITLYAVWGYKYEVVYNLNNDKAYNAPENFSTVSAEPSYSYIISDTRPTDKYESGAMLCVSGFLGWGTEAHTPNDYDYTAEYKIGDTLILTSEHPSVTLYGFWSHYTCY